MPRLTKLGAKIKAMHTVKLLQKHHGNQSAAAREAGITRQSFRARTKLPAVAEALQDKIDKCLNQAGITDRLVYSVIKGALKANSQASFNGTVYESKHADHAKRLAAADRALELMQHKKTAHSEDTSRPTEIHLHYGHRKKTQP